MCICYLKYIYTYIKAELTSYKSSQKALNETRKDMLK